MPLSPDLSKPPTWVGVIVLNGLSIGLTVMICWNLIMAITSGIDEEVDTRDAFLQRQINNINNRLNAPKTAIGEIEPIPAPQFPALDSIEKD